MKYFVTFTALALSACGPVGSGYQSSEPSVAFVNTVGSVPSLPRPPADGQVQACTRSDCGWQAANPGVSPK